MGTWKEGRGTAKKRSLKQFYSRSVRRGSSSGSRVNTGDALKQPMLQGFLPDLRGSGTREIYIGDRLGYNKRVFPAPLGLQYTRAVLRDDSHSHLSFSGIKISYPSPEPEPQNRSPRPGSLCFWILPRPIRSLVLRWAVHCQVQSCICSVDCAVSSSFSLQIKSNLLVPLFQGLCPPLQSMQPLYTFHEPQFSALCVPSKFLWSVESCTAFHPPQHSRDQTIEAQNPGQCKFSKHKRPTKHTVNYR